jgi:hypothetical protein
LAVLEPVRLAGFGRNATPAVAAGL